MSIQAADDDPPEVFNHGEGDLPAGQARRLAAAIIAAADQLDALRR